MSIQNVLVENHTKIQAALPSHIPVGDFVRLALTEVQRNPKLAQCDPQSVFLACMEAARLGVVPGTLGQGYLVPRKGICHFMPGYRLFIELARRSGEVRRVDAEVVHENDEIVYRQGTDPALEHTPKITGDRGKAIGAYAIAHMHDGGIQVTYMRLEEIEKARAAGGGNSPAWKDWWGEMAKKVVIKRAAKLWPLAVDDQRALDRLVVADNASDGIGAASTLVEPQRPLLERAVSYTDGGE